MDFQMRAAFKGDTFGWKHKRALLESRLLELDVAFLSRARFGGFSQALAGLVGNSRIPTHPTADGSIPP